MHAHKLFLIISFLSISISTNLFSASSSQAPQTVSFTKKEITIPLNQACKIIGLLNRLHKDAPLKFQQLCQLCQSDGDSQLTPSDTMFLAEYKFTTLLFTNLQNSTKYWIIDPAGKLSPTSKNLFLGLITHKDAILTAKESLSL
ncbi:hypothetical protein K2W90_04610 [Candidatus Babeliales bacterium]|nr:hypothetical protein [Candidatus Babeliales bacterium]